MRPSTLERKLVAAVLALFLIPTVVAGGVLAYLYRRGTLDDPSSLAIAVLIGFVTMMGYLAFTAHAIGGTLVRALQQIQRGTELMATVNPEHRLQVETGDELQSVAEEINRMADRLRDARLGLEAEVARATHDLESERGKLSAILGELDEGVVVATVEGRVTLANRAAQRLLGDRPLLGKNLFEFVDREKVTLFRDRLRAGQATAERFTLYAEGGMMLQAGMTDLLGPEARPAGFILALRDVSRSAREGEAEQRLLEDALRQLRGSLASIRSLSESLLDDAAAAPMSARPLLDAIHSEAVRLSGLVTGMQRPGRFARAPWQFEEIGLADLLSMSLRRLKAEGADTSAVTLTGAEAGLPPLRVEVSILSVALTYLVRTMLTHRVATGRAWLAHLRVGHVLQLDAGADAMAPAEALESCLDVPLQIGASRRMTVREIARRHAGEAWGYTESGRAGFRLTLPIDEAPDSIPTDAEPAPATRFIGAGLLSGAGGGAPTSARSELYDFSFFEQMERQILPSDRQRRLDELTYVVLDTETTGLRPERNDRIVSLAGVMVRSAGVRRRETFDALVKPGRPVPADSSRFHGITDAMLADAPPIDVVLPAFERFAEGTVLVGHEIWFDLQFLSLDAARIGLSPLTATHPILDVRLLSQAVHPNAADHTLDAIAERMGVAVEGRHSALGDALITAEIFVRLLTLLDKRGIVTLGQALDAARAVRGRAPGDGVRTRTT